VPGFQGPNGFDINRYRMALAEQGLTPAMYESLISHQLSLMKNAALVDSATWVSPMELEDELAAMTDRFTVQAAAISNRFALSEMRLSEEDLRKYYEENKASFALPDRVAVRYISIPVSNYLAHVSVPEDDLMEYYDSHADTYTRTTTNNTKESIPFAEVRDKIQAELQLEEARYCASTAVTFTIYGKLANAGDNALDVAAEQAKAALKTSPLSRPMRRCIGPRTARRLRTPPLSWIPSVRTRVSASSRVTSSFTSSSARSFHPPIRRRMKTFLTSCGRAPWPRPATRLSRIT
jgi:hypothetical protein